MPSIVRITTVPVSLQLLLKGQMKFMKQQGFDVTMISSDGEEVAALIKQEECSHIAVNLTRTISPIKDLIALFKLVKILKRIKPEIVHTHTPKAGLIGMWAAKMAGVPIRLHTIAGLPWVEYDGFIKTILIQVEKLTAFAAHQIFPNSFIQQQFLYQHNIARGKMKVLGKGSSNGINTDFFSVSTEIQQQANELRKSENISQDAWVWIFVGRIVKDKGIAELLEAFVKINASYPDDRLWLLGEEELDLDPLDAKHKEILHHHPAIRCWGFQKDIRPYLAASKLLVFPSYREGFPNVPMQAGAMGCALILSDINGCNEIVNQGKDGWLVPVKNSIELTKAMSEARNHPSLVDEYSNRIREKIKLNYSQKLLWNLLLSEYQNRLNQIK